MSVWEKYFLLFLIFIISNASLFINPLFRIIFSFWMLSSFYTPYCECYFRFECFLLSHSLLFCIFPSFQLFLFQRSLILDPKYFLYFNLSFWIFPLFWMLPSFSGPSSQILCFDFFLHFKSSILKASFTMNYRWSVLFDTKQFTWAKYLFFSTRTHWSLHL